MEQRVLCVALGAEHTLAITESGQLYSWGSNKFGQLGTGRNYLKNNLPQLLDSISNVVQVACGEFHSLALDRTGKVCFLED